MNAPGSNQRSTRSMDIHAAPSQSTISWLILCVALAAAPHYPHLPLWLILLVISSWLWRLLGFRFHWPLPNIGFRLILIIAAVTGVYIANGTLFGRSAGAAFVAVMASIKIIETQRHRDVYSSAFFTYFLVILGFFFSQSIFTGLYTLLTVVLITAVLISLNDTRVPAMNLAKFRLAATLFVQGLPIMLVLFLFFPRLSGPLWSFKLDEGQGVSGLSDSMSPGSISQLLVSDDIAFRVQFNAPPPPNKQLYWRGLVFWHNDGFRWTERRPGGDFAQRFDGNAPPVSYAITLEPHQKRWLFSLDLPLTTPPDSSMSSDYLLTRNSPVALNYRYEMRSQLDYRHAGRRLPPKHRRAALQLPNGFGERARGLARQWRQAATAQGLSGEAAARSIIDKALAWYHDQGFRYTLLAGVLGNDPVDEFLFETRKGYCEHYSGSFTFLMRAAGIPARVVVGYQGGKLNPLADYMIVYQANAHAWSEVWLPDSGWVRVDPTAAIAPDRVSQGVGQALGNAQNLPLMLDPQTSNWLRQARYLWDSVNNGWTQWVLGYGPQRQFQLLKQMGLDVLGNYQTTITLFVGLILVVLLLTWFMFARRPRARDPALRAWERFGRQLQRKNKLLRTPGEGPLAFRKRAIAVLPEQEQQIDAVTMAFIAAYYGPPAGRAEALKRLRQLL